MIKTDVLFGNFVAFIYSHSLPFPHSVTIPISVPKLHHVYTNSRGIPAGKWESRIPTPDADL